MLIVEKLKLSKMKKILKFLFTGTKQIEWNNVHHDVETADSGRYYTFGEQRMYHFEEKWLYIFGIPVWRIYFNCEDKGLYEPSPYQK